MAVSLSTRGVGTPCSSSCATRAGGSATQQSLPLLWCTTSLELHIVKTARLRRWCNNCIYNPALEVTTQLAFGGCTGAAALMNHQLGGAGRASGEAQLMAFRCKVGDVLTEHAPRQTEAIMTHRRAWHVMTCRLRGGAVNFDACDTSGRVR